MNKDTNLSSTCSKPDIEHAAGTDRTGTAAAISTTRAPLLEPYRREIARCVKCGACRAVCPTFLQVRDESQSARGRVALVKAVLDGQLAVSALFKDRLTTCTGCLACEAACPSGVPVTEIIRAAKEQSVAQSGTEIIHALVAGVLRHPAAFRALVWLAPVVLHYRAGMGPGGKRKERTTVNVQVSRRARGTGRGGVGRGKGKGRIAFYPGCAITSYQQDIGRAAISVIGRMGYEALILEDLQCCGRPLLSLGDREAAAERAAQNAAVLEAANADVVLTACASCSLTFKKEYPRLLRPGQKIPSVLDIHEFLAAEITGIPLGTVDVRATYHDPCHLGRGQGLSGTARDILRAIPGLTLVEMSHADRCCGFGGVMRITHHRLSDRIAADKAKDIIATKAAVAVTGCPACRMQIDNALKEAGSAIPVRHTVQVLEEALLTAERGRMVKTTADARG